MGSENEIPTSRRSPPWIDLPGDVTANILERLGAEEILKSAEKVCSTWWKACKDPAMWRVLVLVLDLNKSHLDGRNFDLMCRCAVDRSQGQLTDLRITCSGGGGDQLLNYVVDRSSHLRRLTLEVGGNNIAASGMSEAVKKLGRLEELHLMKIYPLDGKYIEAIGISCPLLKSFTYDEYWGPVRIPASEYRDYCNGIALAVAKTMPNLHHLRLSGNLTKDEALEAILDNCLHLQSLDLTLCFGLYLISEPLLIRCSKTKFLRFS